MPRVLLPLMLALFAGASPAAHAGEAEVPGARIRWADGLEALGRQVVEALPRVRAEVEDRLGAPERAGTAEVAVVQDYDEMVAVTRARVPKWAVGVAMSSRSLIVIRADLLTRGWGGGIVPVLRHEWVHLTWGRLAGPHRRLLPLWAEEGIAEELGGGISVDAGARLDMAVAFDALLDFPELALRFPDDARRADLAYQQSRSWMRFLVAEIGWESLQRALEALRQGPVDVRPTQAFAGVLRAETGFSLGEWHARWLSYLEAETPPWFLLLFRDVSTALLFFLSVVAVIAFFFVARRRRRQIARLPDDGLVRGEPGE